MDPYEFNNIPELTDTQRASPYAVYYYEPILPPATEILMATRPGADMPSSLALAPEEMFKLYIPGSLSAYKRSGTMRICR